MKYTITNTEINNKKASDFETKSLLYLIGFRKDRNEIELIAIDSINDVTGINKTFDKLWDVQAKNHKNLNPKNIGKFLFTLFDNYLSDFTFHDYILFIPKIKDSYLINSSINTYNCDNFEKKTLQRIIKGLKEEVKRVNNNFDNDDISNFLKLVTIVQDNKRVSTYIKSITKFKNKKLQSEDFYKSVFEDIRDKQSSKKNSYIEGVTLTKVDDVLKLNRHLYTKDIQTLIINRIIGFEIFEFQNPISFLPEIRKTSDNEEAKDLLQDCKSDLSRAFFNKNSNKEFWIISEFIITTLTENNDADIYNVAELLSSKISIQKTNLTNKSLLFLISLVKDGLKDENK